jgi:hypothetical protein
MRQDVVSRAAKEQVCTSLAKLWAWFATLSLIGYPQRIVVDWELRHADHASGNDAAYATVAAVISM